MLYDSEEDPEYINLQTELVWLQQHIKETNQRGVIIFEGRDTVGKGGAIMRFIRFLNPVFLRSWPCQNPPKKKLANGIFNDMWNISRDRARWSFLTVAGIKGRLLNR